MQLHDILDFADQVRKKPLKMSVALVSLVVVWLVVVWLVVLLGLSAEALVGAESDQVAKQL